MIRSNKYGGTRGGWPRSRNYRLSDVAGWLGSIARLRKGRRADAGIKATPEGSCEDTCLQLFNPLGLNLIVKCVASDTLDLVENPRYADSDPVAQALVFPSEH